MSGRRNPRIRLGNRRPAAPETTDAIPGGCASCDAETIRRAGIDVVLHRPACPQLAEPNR